MHRGFWLALGLSYFVLGHTAGLGWTTWFVCFAKDVSYWLLFHRFSTLIQIKTPETLMASVTSARHVQMITVLALGEIAVGYWQSQMPMAWEGSWRAIVCLIVVTAISVKLARGTRNYANTAG